MASVRASLEIQADAIAGALVSRKQRVFDNLRQFVVRVLCKDDTGNIVDRLTAFRTASASNYFVTSGHIINKSPASMEVEYYDGTKVAVVIKKFSLNPDVAVLVVVGSTILPNIPFDLAGGVQPFFGEEVFVLACKALSDEFSFSFSEGIVTGRAFNGTEITITVHCDHGFSGAPVVNGRLKIVGVVAGSEGQKIDKLRIVSADRLDVFLRERGFPGLRDDNQMSVSLSPL